jgi:hypothetical protein
MWERRLVTVVGTAAKHILVSALRGLRTIVVTGIVVAVVVVIITEVVGAYLTKSFPPTGATHLAAAALAIAFGWAAAVTVAIGEIFIASIKVIELLIEEAEKAEKKAVEEIGVLSRKAEEEAVRLGHTAARDAGAVGHSALSDAGALGHLVSGAVGGVVGGVEHGAEGLASHIPGHHHNENAPQS